MTGSTVNNQATTKVLEALHEAAQEAGTSDEFTVAVFDFCALLVHYGMSEAAKEHVSKCIRLIRDCLDGVKVRMVREDKLN
jgi:hypothetical protein